jgi:hypothetical protein
MTNVCFNFKGDELQSFITRINKINSNKNKSVYDICIIKDVIVLYNDICIHLQKFTNYSHDNTKYCSIPPSPNDSANNGNPDVFPQAGNFNGEINEGNLVEARTNYECYFPNSPSVSPSILEQVALLFECVLKPERLCNIESKFSNELMILQSRINECPVEDIILFWKTVCIYLTGVLYDPDFIYNCDCPERITNIDSSCNAVFVDQSCNIIKPGPRCDMPPIPNGINDNTDCIIPDIIQGFESPDILSLLEQYVFDPVDGFILYNIVNVHYRKVYRTIVLPLCVLMERLHQNVVNKKNKLIPFNVDDLIEDIKCGEIQGLKIKKLFGTECEITALLKETCLKIDEIHDYYKKCIIIESPNNSNSYFLFTEIQTDHPEWIILGFEPNKNGAGFKFTIVDRCIIETKVLGVLDKLNSCKTELQEFLDKLEICRDQAKQQDIQKEIKTDEVLNRLKNILQLFKDSSNDKFINVDNSKVDINLLVAYKRYLSCITMLRCSLIDCLTEFDNTIININSEHENFCDVLICSVYYKCIVSNRWLASEDRKHNKLPKGFNV